ncbi:universal stress protein, partial [Saccharomonospora iraqiensis]|uniref:universal stress protein n=1 Tax=Saccharomonospora iraqiensis TaxID=52698 RepID=UPI00022E0438
GALAGSTAVGTASHAVAPVVVVRSRAEGEEPPGDGPIVVGVDGSPLSGRAVGYAFEEAAVRRAPLVAVHARADVPEGPRDPLAVGLAGWREKYPDVAVHPVTVREKPRPALLDHSATARLLVVGSRGLGGFRGLLLGSTSQALMHHARCPVMIVRPTGKETP